jgi:DeoR/GlpR family transcriptional regulator of sugar metabolism
MRIRIRFVRFDLTSPAMTLLSSRLPDERQRLILERLSSDGRILAVEFAHEIGASEDTIRRDLRELSGAGLCRRVYGGALSLAPAGTPISARREQSVPRKDALGATAAALVRSRQTVVIDAGSTNEAIAQALPDDQGLTVVTNAPAIAMRLAERPGFDVILIGGRLDSRSGAVLGARALRDVDRLRADLFFVGGCALSARHGLTAFDAEEAEFKRVVAASSAIVVAAITNEKLETAAPFPVIETAGISDLVVEHDAPAELLAGFDATRLRIHRAGSEE